MKAHRVFNVRESRPGDVDHPKPPLSPRRVCADCGRRVYHLGRRRNGTPWVHGEMT
jgi:hypothetical protein